MQRVKPFGNAFIIVLEPIRYKQRFSVHALDDVEGFLFPIQEVDFVVDEHEIAEDGLVLLE